MANHTIAILTTICQNLPIGTNLAMLHFLWMLISGALLPNRGAIIPALKSIGLSDEETRRSWVAFSSGVWSIHEMCFEFGNYVRKLPDWKERRYEGYLPITVDITAYFRPTLQNCPGVHFHPAAQRALPAVNIGLWGEVGELNGQRLALLRRIERANGTEVNETSLWKTLLPKVTKELKSAEIAVIDAGVKIGVVQKAGITRYVLKQAQNMTARRNYLPTHVLGRKAQYGEIVRPIERTRKGKTLPASTPDETRTLIKDGREIRVEIWRALVRTDQKPSPKNESFDIYVFHDPKYKTPWVLATPLKLKPESVHQIYADRWPVEQVPLSSKQMLGAHRQFVHNPECVQLLSLSKHTRNYPAGWLDFEFPGSFFSACSHRLLGQEPQENSWPFQATVDGQTISESCRTASAIPRKAVIYRTFAQRTLGPNPKSCPSCSSIRAFAPNFGFWGIPNSPDFASGLLAHLLLLFVPTCQGIT